MANLTITKISNGFFDFQDENGNNFGGNDITYSYYNTDLKFNQYTYRLEEISYNNGIETIGFASVQECILALKTDGFTGNFNSGGATPQVKTYKGLISNVSDIQTIDLVNTIGIVWSKPEIDGIYYGTFPYEIADKSKIFCLGFSSLRDGIQISDGVNTLSIKMDVSEDINGVYIQTLRNGLPANDVLYANYAGSAILIEDYN